MSTRVFRVLITSGKEDYNVFLFFFIFVLNLSDFYNKHVTYIQTKKTLHKTVNVILNE